LVAALAEAKGAPLDLLVACRAPEASNQIVVAHANGIAHVREHGITELAEVGGCDRFLDQGQLFMIGGQDSDAARMIEEMGKEWSKIEDQMRWQLDIAEGLEVKV
jgi:hypothetical protein